MSTALETIEPRAERGAAFTLDPAALAQSLWRQRRLIFSITLLTAAATAGVSLLRPNVYVAAATLMRNEAKNGLGALDFGNATDLAQAVGIELPGGEGAMAYPAVVESRRVMTAVLAQSFHQPDIGGVARLDSLFLSKAASRGVGEAKAIEWLRKITDVGRDRRTGIWTVSVRHRSPETAAGIANALVRAAQTFEREHRHEQAAAQRLFIETRMESTNLALADAEEALRGFREANVRINKSPALLLAEGRLTRDVRIQGELFLTLTKQHELAKITESWHEPELVVLDWASPPVEKAGPMRTRAVLLAGFAGFGLACAFGLGRATLPDWRKRVRVALAA